MKCIFCDKDLSKEKFREDYQLMPWQDDPSEPESLNKIAKPYHPKCLERFVDLNFVMIKDIVLEILNSNNNENE